MEETSEIFIKLSRKQTLFSSAPVTDYLFQKDTILFADDHWFQKDFGDFRSRYGIRNILQGLFFQYPTEESKWAFSAD